jgi:hypothetical protein
MLKTFGGVELLLPHREDEVQSAVATGQGLVGNTHGQVSFVLDRRP